MYVEDWMTTVLEIVGLLLVSAGVAWIYPPAGVITLGLAVVLWATFAARKAAT